MQTSGFYALTLVDQRREFDDVYTFRFRPESPIPFRPGQYVHLMAPRSGPGRENVRHLSIASVPGDSLLRFTFDLASESSYKQKFRELEPGEKAHLFKVKGEFVLDTPPPSRVVFLAGGLGITPMRSLLESVVAESLPVDWRLLHVARGPHLYENELSALGGVQVRVNRPDLGPVLDDWAQERRDAVWYVAGSHRFVAGMEAALAERGVPNTQIRTEDFE